MTEVSNNFSLEKPVVSGITDKQQSAAQVQHSPLKKNGADVFWRKEKKKNTGLIERLYNVIKNATGFGVGSKKVEKELEKLKSGQVKKEQFIKTVKDYNTSQENAANVLGDLFSVGAAGITYFGLRNEAKLHHAGKKLNDKFGTEVSLSTFLEDIGKGGFRWSTMKKIYGRILAYSATSKTKLALFTTGIAALVGGMTKLQVLQLNRIGSQEFKTDKKDFHGAVNPYDKAAYKIEKKVKRDSKRNSNFRALISGAINGAMMPLAIVGGALVGIPAYMVGNSLNRYFIGQKHSEKTINGYVDNLTNDGVTHAALAAATLIPMAKKGRFSAEFDKNLKIAFDEINAHNVLKDNPYDGKSAFQQINDLIFSEAKIKELVDLSSGTGKSIEERITALSEENIFAVKLKQIENGDELATALQEGCPATRTIEEAAQEIKSKLGEGYKVKTNMGTGTVAETYLVETPEGKEVCVKMLKKGIDADKIARDKQKFIDIVNAQKDKTDAEKKYLIKNIENLAESVSKEIDFNNEMKAAQKLVDYTKTARVVKPIEVKNGLYVMEKADGISLKKLLEINRIDFLIKITEKHIQNAKKPDVKKYYEEMLEYYKKEKENYGSVAAELKLSEKDMDYLIDEYLKVLVEQLYKTDKAGRTLHADIHPGNIFVDTNALKNRDKKAFTLIDTGNTIDLTAEQAERSMRLTQYLEHGDAKDLAKYFVSDADLSASKLSKEEAEKKIEEALTKVFFDSDIRLNTMNNNEIITLTSNIMKDMEIMPGDSQLSLEKARTSAKKSFDALLQIWAQESVGNAVDKKGKLTQSAFLLNTIRKAINKANEYEELQQAQERKNLWQMIKSPKEFFKSQNNPNYKEKNSKDYLVYHLKQDIKQRKSDIIDDIDF